MSVSMWLIEYEGGILLTEEAATQVGLSILRVVYDPVIIDCQSPYEATLGNDRWFVVGRHIHKDLRNTITISKSDCKVIDVCVPLAVEELEGGDEER